MMNEGALAEYRIKFVKLAILLNVLVLVFAGIPLAFFFLHGDLQLWAMAIFALAAVPLSLYFVRLYRATKNYLKEV